MEVVAIFIHLHAVASLSIAVDWALSPIVSTSLGCWRWGRKVQTKSIGRRVKNMFAWSSRSLRCVVKLVLIC